MHGQQNIKTKESYVESATCITPILLTL